MRVGRLSSRDCWEPVREQECTGQRDFSVTGGTLAQMVQRSLAGHKGVKSLWAMHAGGFAMCAPSKQIRRGASEAHISTKFTRRTHGHTRAAHGEHMDTREQHTHTPRRTYGRKTTVYLARNVHMCVHARVHMQAFTCDRSRRRWNDNSNSPSAADIAVARPS
jgi:hypothetical protein